MTENILPPPIAERLKPEYVSPGVAFLVSEDAPSGVILTAAAGGFALARLYETEGVYLGDELTAEAVRDHFAQISDPAGQQAYAAGQEQSQKFLRLVTGARG